MDRLKENISCKDVELLSDEVQEIMSRIPSAIVRWGMTIVTIIVAGLLMIVACLPWPESIECPFVGHRYGSKAIIRITLSPEIVRHLLHTNNKQSITLYSPMLPYEKSQDGISGIINATYVESRSSDKYTTQLDIELYDANNNRDTISPFSGNILLVISEKTLFQRISEKISNDF